MDDNKDLIDEKTYSRLKSLIEILTHSGLRELDEELFKELKTMCRLSPATTKTAYTLILYQLKKQHSEIRFVAFLMCIEFFKRSSLFRKLITKDLSLIFELTLETKADSKMPPPVHAAKMLEVVALSTIKQWHDDYGEVFKELKIGYCFLKHSKKYNFNLMLVHNEMEEEKKRQEEKIKLEKLKKLIEEIDNNEFEIQNTITVLTNCFSLLVPSLDDFFINEDKAEGGNTASENFKTQYSSDTSEVLDRDDNALNLRDFGILSNYSISVTHNEANRIKVVKTEENSPIIQNVEDNIKLLKNRYLPLIKKWNLACAASSFENASTVKRILELKEKMEKCIVKFHELNIIDNSGNQAEISDSDDDDFEEVKKEGYEDHPLNFEPFDIVRRAPAPTRKKIENEWKISTGDDGDPTSACSTIKNLKKVNQNRVIPATETRPSNTSNNDSGVKNMTRKDRLLARAPKLPFDVDLYHWEDENLTAPTLLSVKMDSPKFWGATSVDEMDEIPNPEGLAALRTRVIEFSGTFEPVKWSCRAPLPNGTLCPRKDRYKCPFHGKIVARDENGVCKDETSTNSNKRKMECDWQDPELLRDIKAETGIDLQMPKKRKKHEKEKISKTHLLMETSSSTLREIKNRNFPGLTDIIGKQNNSRSRIAKKIFNRSSLKKVANTMNKMDFEKHRDKFGDQFNYTHTT